MIAARELQAIVDTPLAPRLRHQLERDWDRLTLVGSQAGRPRRRTAHAARDLRRSRRAPGPAAPRPPRHRRSQRVALNAGVFRLAQLSESAPGWRPGGPHQCPRIERRVHAGLRDQQGRERPHPQSRHRTRLELAPPSTRGCLEPVVHGMVRRRRQSRAPCLIEAATLLGRRLRLLLA
jgi:hypothetical protein